MTSRADVRALRILSALHPRLRSFIEHGLAAIRRILPLVAVDEWTDGPDQRARGGTQPSFDGSSVEVVVSLRLNRHHLRRTGRPSTRPRDSLFSDLLSGPAQFVLTLQTTVRPIQPRPHLIPNRPRLRDGELAVCRAAQEILESSLQMLSEDLDWSALEVLQASFDDRVVSRVLTKSRDSDVLHQCIIRLKELAQQSYEGRRISFGVIVRDRGSIDADTWRIFFSMLKKKRFRALSDGFSTAYVVDSFGALLDFKDLGHRPRKSKPGRYFPEWVRFLAAECEGRDVGFCLTRNGDILVFAAGSLIFSYRSGKWIHWTHDYGVDVLHSLIRGKKTAKSKAGKVAAAIYSAALDVAFRRTGGMFVILKRQVDLQKVVRAGEEMDAPDRSPEDAAFDAIWRQRSILSLSRSVIPQIAALDGAIVVRPDGVVLAYAAVLEPKAKPTVGPEEGSRTKAAIGASQFGTAVKVSSDGQVSIYQGGNLVFEL